MTADSRKTSRKSRRTGKAEPFESWLAARIPGNPTPAPGGYGEPVTLASLILHDGPRQRRRFLIGFNENGGHWLVLEPASMMRPWQLYGPDDPAPIAEVMFWTAHDGIRQFAVGENRDGRYSVQPTAERRVWRLLFKRRLPDPELVSKPARKRQPTAKAREAAPAP